MDVILGGGLAGLLISNKIQNSVVIENQPRLGGIFTFEEIMNRKIIYHPPLLSSQCEYFNLSEVKFSIYTKKENFLGKKLGIEEIPKWLDFKERMYYVTNLVDKILELSKKVKVKRGSIFRIKDNRIILNNGDVLTFDNLYVTISRNFISNLLGKKEKLNSISMLELIVLTSKRNFGWDIYINGDQGVSFSHIIDWNNEELDILYILVPFRGNPPTWDKIYSDLKRERILTKDDILAYRSRIIKDAILFGETDEKYPDNIKFCGRLGKWKNFTLCETILDIQNC